MLLTTKLKSSDWDAVFAEHYRLPYFEKLQELLEHYYQSETVYPKQEDVLLALQLTPFTSVKVVLLGQDPYHGQGEAHGLSFSVRAGVRIPPSLRNIFIELQEDIGCGMPSSGDLTKWATQGVLLLNTVLTVRKDTPNSHKGIGWERFTDHIIAALNEREKPIVFVLWGKHAQEKLSLINVDRHRVIASPHPSPFAARRGFFGSRPFSQINRFLRESGDEEIDWQLCE